QENVEVPLYVGKHPGSPSARAKELLTLVGLGHRLGNKPNQLSGGEQQRVAVARALATAPTIVIMDEPTGNLDKANGDNVLQMIGDLRRATGTTFIIATHDPDVAGAADRAIRIVDGLVALETQAYRGRTHNYETTHVLELCHALAGPQWSAHPAGDLLRGGGCARHRVAAAGGQYD